MKKIIALFIVIHLIFGGLMPSINIILNFDLIKSNYLMAGPISEVCVGKDTEEYFPITDERGNSVLTKKEFNRDCTLTKEVQGACIKWETLKEDFVIDAEDYDAYRSRNHEGGMGSLLAMIGAYDQLEHLWSGWRGYCEIGTKTNFDWASDPMFWAGLVASAVMDGSKAGDLGKANQVAVDTAAQGASSEAIVAAWEASLNQSKGFMADSALGQGIQGMQGSMAGALGPLSTWVGPASGQCLMATGFDLGKSLYQYAGSNESDDMCDPVDEFCGDTATQTEESDIITMDRQQYEDMIAKHPEFADYIIILNEENGILTVRYKNINEMESTENMNQAEMDKMKEEMKQMQLVMSTVITAAKMASCFTPLGSSANVSTSAPSGDEGTFSVKNGIGMAISSIPAEWLGPYGILIKAALQILLNFLYSFNDVNTCTNEDDADQAGNRHKKTYEALPHDLCYFVYDKCIDNCGDGFLGLAKELRGYNYCCYDQILTKVLVVQLKAQLGRDWAHCTGITLRDLNFVSFRQCTETEKKDGIDGGEPGLGNIGADDSGPKSPEQGGYDPTDTFQYKNKCIDLTEFKEYLKAQIGDNIDLSDFDSIFNDVKGQAGGL